MPTAFISYSWDSPQHKEWVRRFAADLRARGVDAWLDQWEVRLGDEVTGFMERGVSKADYVLLICTEAFARKANDRTGGGVAYEQAIVTADLLANQPSTGRLVCVLRSGTPSQAIPRYMHSRLWVDLRDERSYTEGLEQLLVHVFQRYEELKPRLVAPEPLVQRLTPAPSAAPEPRCSVLVAGTGTETSFTPALSDGSTYLGGLLGRAGFRLVTCGWPGVDEAVARAFAEALAESGIALEDRRVLLVVDDKAPGFAAGQLVFVRSGEDWTVPMQLADAVVLIGGEGSTGAVGLRALEHRTPVLPIADTGGDAKRLYLRMLKDWDSYSWMNLDKAQYQRLARPGRAGIDALLELLTNVRGRDERVRPPTGPPAA